MVTQNQAVLAAVGASLMALYVHNVPQKAYASLFGPSVPLLTKTTGAKQNTGGGSGAGVGQPAFADAGGTGTSTGLTNLTNAESFVATNSGYSQDWLNWCLGFVNQVFQRSGVNDPTLALPTAKAACSANTLTRGLAPAGSAVCLGGSPDWHIGIANNGGTYTSAGLIDAGGLAGITTRTYLDNPNYLGYFQP